MRISNQLLRSRAARPLYSTELIDLSHLDLVSVDRLEQCPKLQTLILRDNRIEAVPNLDCCPQLWKIDLANNKLRSLEGLSRFSAFGTLILSNNELDWNELLKIRHINILDLTLHGNPLLEMDAYYRLHVIDSLPNIWMLDGRIITSAERAQVQQFFKDTALCDRPVRHKLPRNNFIPSSLKNIKVTGIHGSRTDHFMRHFPHKCTLNIDLDNRRLHYLAYNLQNDVNLELKYTAREKLKATSLIENLITCRRNDQERCNMLLLLLVGSLEFSIPLSLVQQTLEIARLKNIENVKTMDLFMFSRETRCRIASLLLSAVKIERDQNIEGGLYNRLYLSLYDLVSDLVRLANGDDIARYQAVRKKFDTRKSGYRCLLASEIVQLLCIVPAFFDFIGKDPGVMDLISVATKNPDIGEQIKSISWKVQAEGDGVTKVYQEISHFLLKETKEASSSVPNPGKGKVVDVFEEQSYNPFHRMEPSYIITSKRLVRPEDQKPRPSSTITIRPSTGSSRSSTRCARTTTARPRTGVRKPRLGDRVLLGHQACGRLVALPENQIGLVQIDTKAASRFQQADFNLHNKFNDQFYYVNFRHMEWDARKIQWKFSSWYLEFSSKPGNRKISEASEEETMFLSEILQQSLKLRADLPLTQKEKIEVQDDKREGNVLITDHVRSIVRECLQEAEVQWPEEEKPLNPEPTETEQTWTEPERVESTADQSEVTVQVDSDSFTASHDLQVVDEASEERSEVQENQWNTNETTDAPIPRTTPHKTFMRVSDLMNVDMYQPYERYQNMSPSREGHIDREPERCSVHEEEMVSSTENARLEAWKSYELIKRGSSSGFPSRVGSATSRHTPPQRPSTPLHSGHVNPVVIKRADCWLAGGQDVSATRARRLTPPMPGWMEGLKEARRPKSSPNMRNPRLLSATRSRPRHEVPAQPTGGAASVRVSGQPPPSYTRRAQSARVVLHKQ